MRSTGIAAATGFVIGGLAAATLAAPMASATADCSAAGVANTVRSVTGSTGNYLSGHPGAGRVLSAALEQAPSAEANVRGYFTANPWEYFELRGILAPIGDLQHRCGVNVLPPDLSWAYHQFMAG